MLNLAKKIETRHVSKSLTESEVDQKRIIAVRTRQVTRTRSKFDPTEANRINSVVHAAPHIANLVSRVKVQVEQRLKLHRPELNRKNGKQLLQKDKRAKAKSSTEAANKKSGKRKLLEAKWTVPLEES